MYSHLERSVLHHIDDAELIRWVQELTRIPSVWRPDAGEHGTGEAAAAAWVEARCNELGLRTTVEYPHPARPNVIATYGEAGPTLMFEGHTDVVTEGDPRSGPTRRSARPSATGASTGAARTT